MKLEIAKLNFCVPQNLVIITFQENKILNFSMATATPACEPLQQYQANKNNVCT
jgi:hypothetical protein